ncbi:uncharacterized protein RJT20DRAFT_29103 [Scheffersomyces xylosifermentans]|uniref:uncharacterized protein n=1 Tax=Scheffersomyces xylosifermentans TaxID=1304137 RepID=UPI00315CF51B
MEVSPATLEFKGSFTKQSTQFLSLTNTTNGPLAFKVKTTAPKLYCVRPNASIIQPGGTAQISIILQGFSQPLAKDYKCKDKFLLVSLPCPELYDSSKVGESWSELEAKYKTDVVQKKLRVNYIITDDDADYSNGAGNAPAGNDASQLNHRSSDFSGVNDKFAAGPTHSQTNGDSNAFSSGISHNANAFGGDSNGSSGFGGISAGGAAGALAAAGAAGAAGAGILASSNHAPELQRELESSSAQVNNLAQRLDSNAGFGGQSFQQQPQQSQQQPPTPQQQTTTIPTTTTSATIPTTTSTTIPTATSTRLPTTTSTTATVSFHSILFKC